MSVRKPNEPNWIAALCRLYAVAQWLYPRSHRERWGADMRLAFRDRCREAARAGRGPWRVVFADLLPDLAVSVGRERLDDVMELHPMKRMLLIAMLFALSGLLFQARLSVAVEAVGDWWTQYQQAREERALRDHEAALAALLETRGGAHADVVAAELYWASGQGYRLLYPQQRYWTDLNSSDQKEADARLDRAGAAFSRALRANDTWALWLATGDCPARPAICDRDAALKHLQELDVDNGAIWLIDMDLAKQTHDSQRLRAALARLASSQRFDSHYGDAMRGMLAAVALRPMPRPLWVPYAHDGTQTKEQTAVVLAGYLASSSDVMRGLGYKVLLDFCRTRDLAVDAERAADCKATGKLLAARKGTMIEEMFGNRLLLRAASPDERVQVQQSIRDTLWRNRQFYRLDPDASSDAAQRWHVAWMEGGSETQVEDRLLRQNGIAMRAPANFKIDPDYTDPAR